MATVNDSVVTKGWKGMLNKEVVLRNWDNKTVVSKAPGAREGDPTQHQVRVQDRFQMASRYGRAILGDPDLAEAYARVLKPRQNVYSRAMQDYLNPPKVVGISTRDYNGNVGDQIRIKAWDDFRITNMYVEIYALNGALLEKGKALIDTFTYDWYYTARQPNIELQGIKIIAIATDLPGNEGMLEITL
ncbi:hypothetical protein [Flavihumibacter petaseus]|uniref:Uncharacterized protein n=1 Tax=Flavihumibacter petaseus NBRC 106054 TaxID=1220578 RepID=A0A0E9MZI2_9BACT|nr:hypothetical protein [Flavihumibacter petaseus]GAO42520.1 hypothetical protein FPE01S_01_15350 [Flavihumibacter petaseus NBRC 106054]